MRGWTRDGALRRAWAAVAVAGFVLAGCGGGGGGGTDAGGGTTTPPPPQQQVVILDSFGQQVGSDAGIGDGDSGADGTAGEGKPIVNGAVMLTDADGRTASTTTDSRGYYRLKVTGFRAPFVAKVTAPGGTVYHSLNTKAIVRNGFITINLTGLTDKIAYDVAKAGGGRSAADLTPAIVNAHPTVIASSVEQLRTQLSQVISAAGLPIGSFDPLAAPFRADHTGYDFVLDNVVVTRAPDGATTVAVSPAFQPPDATPGQLQGTWELRIQEEGETLVAGQFPGSAVPTAQTVNQFSTAFLQGIVTVDATAGTTATVNGNTITLTGPQTNYTIHVDNLQVTNFQGCTGTCGVGSEVVVMLTISTTEGGLLDGHQVPQSSFTESFSLRYVRVN